MLTCGAHKVLKGSDSEMLSTNMRSELKRTLALRPQPDDGSKDNEDDDNHEDGNEATTRQQQTVHARVPTQVSCLSLSLTTGSEHNACALSLSRTREKKGENSESFACELRRADNDNDNDNYRSAASGYVRGMEAEEIATTAMLSRTMRGKGEKARKKVGKTFAHMPLVVFH
ncbi:hypothetical protein ACLKA7_012446 [Drosophila subpalustris]